MKNLKITFLLCLFSFSALYAQTNSRLEKALLPIMADLEKAASAEDLKPVVNKLERISQAEAAEWIPTYHLGYAYLNMAMMSKGSEVDRYLNLTQQQLDKLAKMEAENSEIVSLQAFKHIIYMVQDQGSRAREYSPKITEMLKKAVALDPENPRAMLLSGQMMYNSALFFKTSTAEACGMIQRALQLYDNQEENTLKPSWGKEMALEYGQKCEEGQASND